MAFKTANYEFGKLLGEGEFGQVFVGTHLAQACRRAVKVLRPEYCAIDSVSERFQREANIGTQIQSEFVVEVLDSGTTKSGEPFFAMRLASGQTMLDWMADHPLRDRQDIELLVVQIERILTGLEAVHGRRYVHRDLKPLNILMSAGDNPVPMISDLGIALSLDDAPTLEPIQGLYTAGFAPKEQVANANDATVQSDVWGVGAILYLGLTQKLPYGIDANMQAGELIERMDGVLTPPSDFAKSPRIDPTLDAICCKALDSDPEKRYATAKDFAHDLRQWRANAPVAGIDGWLTQGAKLAQQHRRLAVLGGLVFAALSIGLASAAWGLKRASDAAQTQRLAVVEQERAATYATQSQDNAIELLSTVVLELNPLMRYQSGAGSARAKILSKIPPLIESLQENPKPNSGWKRTHVYSLVSMADIIDEFAGDLKIPDGATTGDDGGVGDAKQWLNRTLQLRQQAVEVAHEIRNRDPSDSTFNHDYLVTLFGLSQAQQNLGDNRQASRTVESALKLAETLAASTTETDDRLKRDLAAAHNRRASLQRRMGKYDQALNSYMEQSEILEQLAAGQPEDSRAVRDWALSLAEVGNQYRISEEFDKAQQFLEQAHRLRQQRAELLPRDTQAQRDWADSNIQLGHLASTFSQLQQASGYFAESVDILRRLQAQNPGSFELIRSLATGLQNVGDVQGKLRDLNSSAVAYLECIRLREDLRERAPQLVTIAKELGIVRVNYGTLLKQDERLDEAVLQLEMAYQDCLRLGTDNWDAALQRNMLIGCNQLGDIFLMKKKTADAQHWYERGLSLSRKRYEQNPSDVEADRDLAIAYAKLGDLYFETGQAEKAIEYFRQSQARAATVLNRKNAMAVLNYVAVTGRVGDALAQVGKHEEATAEFQLAIEELTGIRSRKDVPFLRVASAKMLASSSTSQQALGHFAAARSQLQEAMALLESLKKQGKLSKGDLIFEATLQQGLISLERKVKVMGDWQTLLKESDPAELAALLDVRQMEMLKAERYADALQAADELAEMDGLQAAQWYNVACVRSRAASHHELTHGREQRSTVLQEQAIAALRQSIDSGWSNLEHLQSDPDLAALRDTQAYQDLVQEALQTAP